MLLSGWVLVEGPELRTNQTNQLICRRETKNVGILTALVCIHTASHCEYGILHSKRADIVNRRTVISDSERRYWGDSK